MQRKDIVILKKIIDEIDVVRTSMGDMSFDEFNSQEMFKRGVCMTVINIGELVKNLSEETRLEHSHIPWKDIAGFRDITAHKYQTLNMKDVYSTITNDFDDLRTSINQIITSNPA